MKKNKKQTKSFLSQVVSTITALAFLVNIAVPLLAFAAPGYSISITS